MDILLQYSVVLQKKVAWEDDVSIDIDDTLFKLAIEYYTYYNPNPFPINHFLLEDIHLLSELYTFSKYYMFEELSTTLEISQCVYWMKKCYHTATKISPSFDSSTTP